MTAPSPTTTVGYRDDKAAIQKRLRRIEGQVRGLQRMVEEDRYCINILDQVSAATRGAPIGVPRTPRSPPGALRGRCSQGGRRRGHRQTRRSIGGNRPAGALMSEIT